MTQIQNHNPMEKTEVVNFLEDLPFRLRVKTIMHIYKESYQKITYLRTQNNNFLAWICPLLSQVYIPMDQYIYYETDLITEIYFMTKGLAGFVLPCKLNIVFLYIGRGEYFGEIDLVAAA